MPKKAKLYLEDLKVNSFVTLPDSAANEAKARGPEVPYTQLNCTPRCDTIHYPCTEAPYVC